MFQFKVVSNGEFRQARLDIKSDIFSACFEPEGELPELDKQQARLNIKKKYQENFNKIIGTNRCERFFRMDGEFKRKLMERVQKQRNNPPRQNQRPNMKRGQ